MAHQSLKKNTYILSKEVSLLGFVTRYIHVMIGQKKQMLEQSQQALLYGGPFAQKLICAPNKKVRCQIKDTRVRHMTHGVWCIMLLSAVSQ